MSGQQREWIAARIFANECSSNSACLTSWNPGEDFPSLGLGHFIWYRAGQQEIYRETFPDLIAFYHELGLETPNWITELPDLDAPWLNRDQFYAEFDGQRLTGLRQFLQETLAVQAQFIVQRQELALDSILEQQPQHRRAPIAVLYRKLAASEPPLGRYALIDYVNFKGEGTDPRERYQGQGWGLLQVLEIMLEQPEQPHLPSQFADAAAQVLRQRVANAPVERNEQRWLAGWLNRVDTYRELAESQVRD